MIGKTVSPLPNPRETRRRRDGCHLQGRGYEALTLAEALTRVGTTGLLGFLLIPRNPLYDTRLVEVPRAY